MNLVWLISCNLDYRDPQDLVGAEGSRRSRFEVFGFSFEGLGIRVWSLACSQADL